MTKISKVLWKEITKWIDSYPGYLNYESACAFIDGYAAALSCLLELSEKERNTLRELCKKQKQVQLEREKLKGK